MKRNQVFVIGFCLFVWLAFILALWQVAHGDGGSLPPECPPGLVCDGYPGPYPAPYPAPDFLPLVAGENYP